MFFSHCYSHQGNQFVVLHNKRYRILELLLDWTCQTKTLATRGEEAIASASMNQSWENSGKRVNTENRDCEEPNLVTMVHQKDNVSGTIIMAEYYNLTIRLAEDPHTYPRSPSTFDCQEAISLSTNLSK